MSISRVPIILAVLGVASIWLLLINGRKSSDADRATIDEPDRVMTDLAPGQAVSLTFALRNPTPSTVRVVGLGIC